MRVIQEERKEIIFPIPCDLYVCVCVFSFPSSYHPLCCFLLYPSPKRRGEDLRGTTWAGREREKKRNEGAGVCGWAAKLTHTIHDDTKSFLRTFLLSLFTLHVPHCRCCKTPQENACVFPPLLFVKVGRWRTLLTGFFLLCLVLVIHHVMKSA